MLQVYDKQTHDDGFSVIIDEPDDGFSVIIEDPVLARSCDAQGGHNPSPVPSFPHHGHVLRELHLPRSANIPAEWARSQTDVREAPDERHSRQPISFQHPGTKIGKVHQLGSNNIQERWPTQEKKNNEGHLMTLLMSQMKNMKEEIIDLKSEHIKQVQSLEKMQNALKRIREHKEKDVFCFHCCLFYSGNSLL